MGLVLDSGVLIAAERDASPVSRLLARLEHDHGETEIVLSAITVIELEHGLYRAQTAEHARKRREYLDRSKPGPYWQPTGGRLDARVWPSRCISGSCGSRGAGDCDLACNRARCLQAVRGALTVETS